MLQLEHISKAFGTHQVLDDISFHLHPGEAIALLGSNGAGKTTLLRIITQLIRPDSGTLLLDGHPMRPADLNRIGYLPEERGLYRHMRAAEQITYLAQLKGLSRSDARHSMQQWFARLGMDGWQQQPTSHLSKGMQQKLQFVATVAHRPSLLILDEPFSGFDADNAQMLTREVLRLKQDGTAIILATHNLQAAHHICNLQLHLPDHQPTPITQPATQP